MSTEMTESQTMDSRGHGGVGHLLRMAKMQCGVAVAFAALRKTDGGFAIATFPSLATDPTWTVEAIDELVKQTWDDPMLGGGKVLVRSGRILKGMWTGQSGHTKLAAAALSDIDAPDRPWGLLCVAEPLSGHFEQDQLNLVGELAQRLTSYLRARQEVLDPSDKLSTEPSYRPLAQAEEEEPWARSEPDPFGVPEVLHADFSIPPLAPSDHEPSPIEEPAQYVMNEPQPYTIDLDDADWIEAIPTNTPAPAPQSPPVQSRETSSTQQQPAQDWLLSDEASDEWLEAEAEAFSRTSFREVGRETTEPTPDEPTPGDTENSADRLSFLIGPDPLTGLATLPTLLGRLGEQLGEVRNHEGAVALVLIDALPASGSGTLNEAALLTIAGRLKNHIRERDLAARIDSTVFAVLANLRSEDVAADSIRQRIVDSVLAGTDSSSGGLAARSSMAVAAPGSTTSPEELLGEAAQRLDAK